MGKSIFTGPQIDEALAKALQLRIVNNGWILLNSTVSSPINLNELFNPGNYTIQYWTNGPDITGYTSTPGNINVLKINTDLYQFMVIGTKHFVRNAPIATKVYGNWKIDQSEGAVNPGTVAPENPVNGSTLWIDTTTASAPVFKLFYNDAWHELVPSDGMSTKVYDTTGKKTDIFNYIDQKVIDANIGTIESTINAHILNADIHPTAIEKEKWNTAATQEDVDTAAATMRQSLQQAVESAVASDISKVQALITAVAEYKTIVDTHVGNSSIHPNADQQAIWTAKAAPDHLHNNDGRVTVDTEHVTGNILASQMPYDVKERAYVFSFEGDRLKLVKNPVHNGDAICVTDDDADTWYFVIDDTKLGNLLVTTPFIESTVGTATVGWQSICYGNGKYIAVTNSTKVAYSTDGITWTEVTISATSRQWGSVCYGNGKFVAVVYNSTIAAYSTDGITWTEVTISATSRSWNSICYGNGKYVIVANNLDMIAYSTDGITWIEVTISDTNKSWYSICYGNGKYILVGNSFISAYSTDGIAWTEVTISSTSSFWYSVCYGNGKFVAIGYDSDIFTYSTDGITWTEVTAIYGNWQSICYGNGKFVAVAGGSNKAVYSIDGIIWTEVTISTTGRNWMSICYGNGKYIAMIFDSNIFSYGLLTLTCESAFLKLGIKPENFDWNKVINTPTTLVGYGITDAATKELVDEVNSKLDAIDEQIPKPVDLSSILDTQAKFNEILTGFNEFDTVFNSLDAVINKLTAIIV